MRQILASPIGMSTLSSTFSGLCLGAIEVASLFASTATFMSASLLCALAGLTKTSASRWQPDESSYSLPRGQSPVARLRMLFCGRQRTQASRAMCECMQADRQAAAAAGRGQRRAACRRRLLAVQPVHGDHQQPRLRRGSRHRHAAAHAAVPVQRCCRQTMPAASSMQHVFSCSGPTTSIRERIIWILHLPACSSVPCCSREASNTWLLLPPAPAVLIIAAE